MSLFDPWDDHTTCHHGNKDGTEMINGDEKQWVLRLILALKSYSNKKCMGPRGNMNSHLGSMPQVPIPVGFVAT